MKVHALIAAVVGLLLCEAPRSEALTDIAFGEFVIAVSDSWTAQLFHIVDQLSEWDQFTHRQYGRWARKALTLDAEDRRLLQRHAELRRGRGWGKGFEQAFYVDTPIDVAADDAVSRNLLSAEEAAAEREILQHFAPKLLVLRESGAADVKTTIARLSAETERIAPLVQRLLRFTETKQTDRVPVFLVPNPEEGSGGGGYNGGRLVVEVQQQPDPVPFLLHEALHVLLQPHSPAIEAAAKSVGLTVQALNEGIAYAFAPGLIGERSARDVLVEALVQRLAHGAPASDSYVQFYMIAAVLRPSLQKALADQETNSAFLPRAAERWRDIGGR
jgi:hypothetical protein